MRVSRRDVDAGVTAPLTSIQRMGAAMAKGIDTTGTELSGPSCACYVNRTGDGKADACECHTVVDTAHGPRWRASGKADTADESPVEKAQREMHERHGTAQSHADEGEGTVERARRECHERGANAWRAKT